MAMYPYVHSNSKLEDIFDVIRKTPQPDKFTYRYLANLGFSSSQDRKLIPLLKFLNYLDSSGKPTHSYKQLRDINSYKASLAEHVLKAYKDIILIDTKAPNVSEDVLVGYFSRFENASEETLFKIASTFKELCMLADISKISEEQQAYVLKKDYIKPLDRKETINKREKISAVKLSINLPSTTDTNVYEVLFKHLKDLLD